MEYDRYKYHPIWYIVGTILYLFALGSLALSLYLLPYFFFKLTYNVPEFIIKLYNMLQNKFEFSDWLTKTIILSLSMVSAIISAIFAKIITTKLDPKDKES
jgi:hypothetical protein